MVLDFKKNDVVVFDGDSLTRRSMTVNRNDWPYLRLMNWDDSWANTVEELMFCWRPELDLKFFNTAVGGSTSQDLFNRVEECVLPLNPNWVIVTIGTNDSNISTLSEFDEMMRKYIERLNEKILVKVLLLGGFRESAKFVGEKACYNRAIPFFEALKQIAVDTGNYYLDVGEILAKKSEILFKQSEAHTVFGDGVHFNKIGNNIIAGEVLKAFGIIK